MNRKIHRLTILALMIALDVFLTPIFRIEGMAFMSSVVNVVAGVFMSPLYAMGMALITAGIRIVTQAGVATVAPLAILGASPAMSEYKKDLEDLLPFASGLLINIGTLNDQTWQGYKDALDIAERYGIPTVLDPVAAGAGAYRKSVALDLLEHHKISLVRGNAGEIAALIGEKVDSKGVDSGQVEDIGQLALRANQILQRPVVITGVTDAIAVEGQVRLLKNGSSLMPLVTGTGCLLGAVLAAFIHLAEPENLLDCLEEVLSVYNIAGELAGQKTKLPGTFQIEFLNSLYRISSDDVVKFKKVEQYG